MKRLILSITLIGLCFTLFSNTLAQEPETSKPSKDKSEAFSKEKETHEIWRKSTPAKITLHTTLPSGDLFVSSDDSTMLLSAASGKVVWERKNLVSCDDRIRFGPVLTCRVDGKWEHMSFLGRYLRFDSGFPERTPSKFLFETCGFVRSCMEARLLRGAPKKGLFMEWKRTHDDERLLLVDLETGKDAFDTLALGFKRVYGTCLLEDEGILIAWEERNKRPALAAAFDLPSGKTLWTAELPLSKNIVCLPLDGAGLWVAYGESDRGKKRVFGIESSTGRPRWENVELVGKDWGELPTGIADSDSTAVLHLDKSGPIKINLHTGAVQWRADAFRGDQPAGDVHGRIPRPQPIVRHGDQIFITQRTKVAALDSTSGAVVWTRDLSEPVMILGTRQHGLLVRTYGSGSAGKETINLHMLRYETGKTDWSNYVGLGKAGWLLRDDTIFYMANKKLCSLALDTGVVRELGPVEFEGDEIPSDIDVLDDALVVSSSQNIAAFECDGRIRYKRYYQAPGLSRLEKVLIIAAAAAANYARSQIAASSARATARDTAFLRGGTGTGTAFYNASIPNLSMRFRSTTNAERFIYMYTEQPDDSGREGFSLVQLDKRDGRETGRVWSKDRRPDLAVDPFAARVFIKTSDSEITAYAFATVK